MAKKIISEDARKKALEYRALTFEKYNNEVEELEAKKQLLIVMDDSKQQRKEIKACCDRIAQIKLEVENIGAIPEDMFLKVILERDLLLNVIFAFDQGKIEKREAHLISSEKAEEIEMKRQERKKTCRKMSVEELLDEVISNEKLEIEILKIKTAHHQRTKLVEEQRVQPSSR